MFLSRQKPLSTLSRALFPTRRLLSDLRDRYSFQPPPPLSSSSSSPNPQIPSPNSDQKKRKSRRERPRIRPPSSLDEMARKPPLSSDLPFDFRFSYTESSTAVRPIGLREPKYSPFGPGRVDREWTGVCAPAVDPTVRSVEGSEAPAKVSEAEMTEKRRIRRERVQGETLTAAERTSLVESCRKGKTKRQINLGRDGLTHNMLNEIQNHWKHAEAVRIKCLGVPTVDMENVCSHLEEKTFGKVIHKHSGLLILYRGRNYNHKKRPVLPIMLWKPHEPIYPKLIKTTIDGLSIEETKEMRKRGLAAPGLTKLTKNGYYGNLVPMVRDAFLVCDLIRIDCQGLEKSDFKKIGVKLRDLVPCVLVTFDKDQIVVWRGNDYRPPENGHFLSDSESVDDVDPACTESGPCPSMIDKTEL